MRLNCKSKKPQQQSIAEAGVNRTVFESIFETAHQRRGLVV